MKYLFATKSNPKPQTYDHGITVTFPKQRKGHQWSLQGKGCATPDDWVEAARKLLLSIGITDFQIINTTAVGSISKTQCRSFYFKNEIDMLQFQSLALQNTKRDFIREFSSPTIRQSQIRERNLSHFITENEIEAAIVRLSPLSFKVTTGNRADYIAISIQQLKGTFDIGIEHETLPPQSLPRILVKQ